MASIVRYKERWRAYVRTTERAVSKVFGTKREAVLWARDQEACKEPLPEPGPRGRRPSPADEAPRTGPLTFGDVLDCYERDARRAVGSSKKSALKVLRAGLGRKRLTELDARTFISFGRERSATVAAATVGGELTYAGSALKFSGVLLDAVPETTTAMSNLTAARTVLNHMGIIAPSHMRDRRPTEKELRKIRDYCLGSKRLKTPIWEMVLFAIATAMRLGEITRIRWEDVDEEARIVRIRDRKHPTRKQGNDGKVPLLVGPATVLGEVVDPLEIMRKLSPLKRGRIFPYASGTTTTKFIYICNKLKIEDLHFHDFRHDAVSRLFEFGYRIEQVALVSGHKDWKHLKRYTNINPESLHDVT